MIDDTKARRLGLRCRESRIWRWTAGMVAVDTSGPFAVPSSGYVSDEAWPDLRAIPTQMRAYANLMRWIPDLRVWWATPTLWKLYRPITDGVGRLVAPEGDTLAELLAAIYDAHGRSTSPRPSDLDLTIYGNGWGI
jgi:hypothetical protein